MTSEEYNKKNPIFGTDFNKPLSELIDELENRIVTINNTLTDIELVFPDLEDKITKITKSMIFEKCILNEIKKEAIKREISEDDKKFGESLYFASRGIGSDWCRCFVCEESDFELKSNIAAFIKSKEDGENILSWFNGKAKVDFRPSEPNWIQIKIGACEKHLPNLKHLDNLTSKHCIIRKSIIEEAVNFIESKENNND